jgi:hypothetical protein
VYNAFKPFGGSGGGGANASSWQQNGGGAAPYAGRERERFEVYKTMAERAAEFGRNECVNPIHLNLN